MVSFSAPSPLPTPPSVRTPAAQAIADSEIWGMPIELAVGLVGVVGALVGAGLGAWVSWHVAQTQRRHEVRQAALTRIRDRAAVLMTSATRLAVAANSGTVTAELLYEYQEGSALLGAEAGSVVPDLARFIANARVSVLEEAVVGDATDAAPNLAVMSGIEWNDMHALAVTTRDGLLGWLSGEMPHPDFNALLSRRYADSAQ